MTVNLPPPPIQHPMVGVNGLTTQPWVEYFNRLAVQIQNADGGYMLRSTYDPTNSGSVVDSDRLGGQLPAYYLAISNTTGPFTADRFRWDVVSTDADASAELGQFVDCDATSAAITVTLPTALGNDGYIVAVSKSDASANLVTIQGAETINGASSQTITAQYTVITLMSDGTEWRIICAHP